MHFIFQALVNWIKLTNLEVRGGEIGDEEAFKHRWRADDNHTQCVGGVWQVEGWLDLVIVPLHLEGVALQTFTGAVVT